MACNCSIGGPAKAHLVREIDALGGEMARAIDRTFTHIRLLNVSRGPAVQALRAQADKALYRATMKATLEAQPGLTLLQDTAEDLRGPTPSGIEVATAAGRRFYATAVVVATGTFLNGEIHIGEVRIPAGRAGEGPARGLSDALTRLGLELRRFKTGTVPRVLRESLDLGELQVQPSDQRPLRFAYRPVPRPSLPLLPCFITATTEETHKLLRRNAHRSALWSGQITGIGPRYCPSIEAKLERFPERTSHRVFLELEGWHTREVYVQGLSNSMPADVQEAMLHSVPGLRHAKMIRPGYAIEYDCIDARVLDRSLAFAGLPGLYLAGQVNGTSGYEEAAAQGLIAGINAARFCRGLPPLTLERTEGYIGVLLDDLTRMGTDEPYRMLTSRAEGRLCFGQDTAWYRLLGRAREIGLVPEEELAEREAELCADSPQWSRLPLATRGRRAQELEEAAVPYIRREEARLRSIRRLASVPIPEDLDFRRLPLRREAVERLCAARPRTVGELAALAGITPADVATVHAAVTAQRGLRGERPEGEEG
jgi:tRNA uridine 5-carboxymethylaminomethyl modification enzyme